MAVICPKCPIALRASVSRPKISAAFQKPNTQCCLNAAMPHIIPLESKCGMLHLSVSCTSGHPVCTILRRCLRIGRANGAAFAMYSSIRGSLLLMVVSPKPKVPGMAVEIWFREGHQNSQCCLQRQPIWILREIIRDLIPRGKIIRESVELRTNSRVIVECAHSNRDLLAVRPIPAEQA